MANKQYNVPIEFVPGTGGGGGSVVWNNIQSATGNLTLSNGSFDTEFDQTGNMTWLWKNTTTATSGTTNASPQLELAANYWTGATSAQDTWEIGSSLAAGTNGASTLTITHSGSSGPMYVNLPSNNSASTPDLVLGNSTNPAGIGSLTNGSFSLYSAADTGAFYFGFGTTVLGAAFNRNATGIPTYSLYTQENNSALTLSGNQSTTAGETCIWLTNSAATNSSLTATSGLTQAVVVGTPPYQGSMTWAPASGTGTFTCFVVNPTINNTGSSGSYTALLVNAVETSLNGTTSNKLLTLQAGASGGTTKFEVNNSGVVDNYKGNATTRNGVPATLASSDLTAQSAAITATTLLSAPYTGAYRISWSADITTASDISSVLGGANGFQAIYTSPTDSVVKTTVAGASVTSAANTTGTATSGVLTVYAKTGTNIQFTFGYTDSHTSVAMNFELHVSVEGL